MKRLTRFAMILLFFGAVGMSPALADDPGFTELQTNPEAYQGQEIVLGGEVITVRQYDDTTQMEIMQLPLGPGQEPQPNQALTQGRFLAFQKGGLNPATVLPHTRVTIFGQIVGSAVADPEHATIAYPVIAVKSLTIWQVAQPIPAQLPQPAPPPVDILPPPIESAAVFEQYYWTPYWEPAVSVWSWRPFWVYPWWASPVVVVPPPRLGIVRPHPKPFGPPPRKIVPLPPRFVPRHGPVLTPPSHSIAPLAPLHIKPGPRYRAPHQFSPPVPPRPRAEYRAGSSGRPTLHGQGRHRR